MKSLARSVIYIDSEIVELCHSTPLPKLPCIPGCYQRDRGHECMWVMPSFFKETGYSFFHPLTNGQAERLVQSFKKSCDWVFATVTVLKWFVRWPQCKLSWVFGIILW